MALTKADIERAPYNRASITGYNRLEGVQASIDYRKSVSAEIHDAMWMLSRQWQMGEYDGEDAGTAVKTKLLFEQQKMTHMDTGNKNVFLLDRPFDGPLEMAVEREGRTADLAFRMETGKLFKAILNENNLQAQLPAFLGIFRIQLLEQAKKNSPEGKLVSSIRSDRNDAQVFDALKNRVLDGFAIFGALTEPGDPYGSWVRASLAPAGTAVVANAIKAGQEFLAQFNFFYGSDVQKTNSSWRAEQLSYQFNIQTDEDPAKAMVMEVKSYPGGRLDWFDFDISQVGGKVEVSTRTFIPSPVTFPGMPKPRWWEMEENEINFGNINVKTTDLLSLILIDFALIYGNDWLLIPFPMELNNLCTIKGFLVKDVFGTHTYIPPVNTGSDVSWEKWSLFSQTTHLRSNTEPLFYLAPGLLKPLEQEPVEKVSFLRDEASNMAWAFENVIPGAMGKGLSAPEVSVKEDKEEPPTSKEQVVKYMLGTDVPFYQVPFIPVETGMGNAQIRLQRAMMPGGLEPRGVLLTEVPSPYYIREENISRAGTMVTRRWQRTRWINGVVAQWIGRERLAGKSEGATSLLFDVLSP